MREQNFVIIATNATNVGDPQIRALVVDVEPSNPTFVHDIAAWLLSNGIQCEVVSPDKYHQKLQNYRERVAAAS